MLGLKSLRWFAAAIALCVFALAARAQTVTSPTIAQVYDGGRVHAVAVQSDGKVIIGGLFTNVAGAARSNLARINADGTLDAAWNTGTDATVYALTVDAAGNLYVGGDFSVIGGVNRNYIAKIASNGTVDATWNPNADDSVLALAVDAGGNLFAGGWFNAIGGQTRNYVAKLSTGGTGAADATWNPNADFNVNALKLDGTGNLYVGGWFDVIGGLARPNLVRVSTSGVGAVDAAWNPDANGEVQALALDGSGNLYVGGWFTSIGGRSRHYLAKLSTAGAGPADVTWDPNPDEVVYAVAVDASGVYAGGDFVTIGGFNRGRIAKLSATGVGPTDGVWNASASSTVQVLALDASGKLYIGGDFNTVGGLAKGGFGVVTTASSNAIAGWPVVLGPGGSINAIVRDGSGRTIIGGSFIAMGDKLTLRASIARFNADGTLDATWAPNSNGYVGALAVDASGNVFAGGGFSTIGGLSRVRIAKLSPAGAGAADAAFDAGITGSNTRINTIALDGTSLYAGGDFAAIGGQARNQIAKLSAASGAADAAWNAFAGVTDDIYNIVVSGGSVFVGGSFSSLGSQSRSNIAKLTLSNGIADPTWNPGANGTVRAIEPDASGNLYVGGSFTTLGGSPRGRLALVSASGSGVTNPTWNPGANGSVYALKLDAAGKLYAAGFFSTIDGGNRTGVARLSASGTGLVDGWIANTDSSGAQALAVVNNSVVYVGGTFDSIAGQSRLGLASLSLTAPTSPKARSATPGNGSAVLTFDPPTSNGGAPVTGSFLTCNPGNITATGLFTTTINMSGFVNDTAYDCTLTASNAGGTSAASSVLRFTPSATPHLGPFAFVANQTDENVSVIRVASNKVVATVGVGPAPRAVAVNPTAFYAYVVNTSENSVSVIDIATYTETTTITVGSAPRGIALKPDGTRAYVTNFSGNSVSVINTATNAVIATIPVAGAPDGVAINAAGTRVYVASNSGLLSVIDTGTNSIVNSRSVGVVASLLAVNPAGTRGYVSLASSTAVVDLATLGVLTTVPAGGSGYGIAVNPSGTRAYITNGASTLVSVLDTASNTLLSPIPAGGLSQGIAVSPDGTRVYVANNSSWDVTVIDAAAGSVSATINVGRGPRSYGQFVGGKLPTVPDAPTITQIVRGNGQLTVHFTPAANDGGVAVTHYTVVCNPGGFTASGASSPITVTGLANTASYTCTVTATNAIGNSLASAGVNGVPTAVVTGATIVTASSHALALDSTGRVFAWGSDSYGQLGQNRAFQRLSPTLVPAVLPAMTHIAISDHVLAVDIFKQVWSWGDNECGGQLGPRDTSVASQPARVRGAVNMTKVAAGACFSIALRTDGTVWGWGDVPGYGPERGLRQLTGLASIIDIVAGDYHALALRADGIVLAFGENTQGELGLGFSGPPRQASGVGGLPLINTLTAGHGASMVLSNTGTIHFWGRRANGTFSVSPTTLPSPGLPAMSISLAGNTPIAVRSDGLVRSFDAASNLWQSTPFSGTSKVVAGDPSYMFAITSANQLFATGANQSGQLGLGDTTFRAGPVSVPGMSPVSMVAVAMSSPTVVALKTDGTIHFWGANPFGQSGDSNGVASSVPLLVPFNVPIKSVATGDRFSVAVDTSGNVWGWGDARSSPFGSAFGSRSTPALTGMTGVQSVAAGGAGLVLYLMNNNTVVRSGTLPGVSSTVEPTAVPGLGSITRIAAGSSAYAVRSDGILFSWGNNAFGELGNGGNATSATPVTVQGFGGAQVSRVSAGNGRASAITTDGRAWSWGKNLLGNGSAGGSLVAVPASGITDAVEISVGEFATLVRRSNGFIAAWGNTGIANAPTQYSIAFHETVQAVAAGAGHSLGFVVGASGVPWGFGDYGTISTSDASIGDGTYVPRHTPVTILANGGSGSIDANNWYLDLDPESGQTIPTELSPKALGVARIFGSEVGLSLDVKVKFKSNETGVVNIYVLALVPTQFMAVVKNAPSAPSMEKMREMGRKNGGLILVMLTSTGWSPVVGLFEAYRDGVTASLDRSIAILANTPITSGKFCVGYGASPDSMLSAEALREVLNFQGGVTPLDSSVPCVLVGLYLDGLRESTLGSPVKITASVVGVKPQGSVQFTNAGVPLESKLVGTKNDAVSTAEITLVNLPVGIHPIGATYAGVAPNPSVTADPPLRHEVKNIQPGQTTTTLSGPNASPRGTKVVFVALVSGNRPSGAVRFFDNRAGFLGEVPLPPLTGKAIFETDQLSVDDHLITARYIGDTFNNGSDSNSVAHKVTQVITTSVALSASTDSAKPGEPVQLIAIVTGLNPTGSVTFRDGDRILGTQFLQNGSATITLTDLTPGTHFITADYSGDTNGNDRVTSYSAVLVAISTPAGALAVTPSSLSFGGQSINTTSAPLALTIQNTGGGAPSVTSITASSGFSVVSHNCGTLTPGLSCVANVTFLPRSQGTITGTLTIVSSVGPQAVSLSGVGERSLVTHYYRSILRRAPEASGKAFWEAEALRVSSLGANVNEVWYSMAMSFYFGAEYAILARDNAGFLTDLYNTFFNRAPDAAGFNYWLSQLASGMPREGLLANFMFSTEFAFFTQAIFGNTNARGEINVVMDFYRGAFSRLPDTAGFNFYLGQFRRAQCQGPGAVFTQVEDISKGYFTSLEYGQRNRSNLQYVSDLYNAFLRRGPDLAGINFYVNQLASGKLREAMRQEFKTSPEFNLRVNAILAETCIP